ncbi:MAG: hypothetical protein H0W06_05095 [Chloroflexia bacterium]|nr:hypothetical protein [Chloroflexia bacterium]
MALEEYLESEVAVAIAATAVAFSPRARRLLRRGAVYGLAGALTAGDAITAFTRGAARGARQAAPSAVQADLDAPDQAAGGLQGEGGQP